MRERAGQQQLVLLRRARGAIRLTTASLEAVEHGGRRDAVGRQREGGVVARDDDAISRVEIDPLGVVEARRRLDVEGLELCNWSERVLARLSGLSSTQRAAESIQMRGDGLSSRATDLS